MSIFLTIVPIALLDALNPSAILLTIIFLTTKGIKNALVYIAGIFLAYFAIGLIGLAGIDQLTSILSIFTQTPSPIVYYIQAAIAIILLIYAFRIKPTESKKTNVNDSKLLTAFVLGVTVTFIESSTALPYLGAITIISSMSLISESILLLFIYNLIFISIPLNLVGLKVFRKNQFERLATKARKLIDKSSYLILKFLMIALGLFLLGDFIAFFLINA